MKPISLTISILLFLTLSTLFAQKTHTLSLDKALEVAQERSYRIRYLKENFKIAQAQLTAATNSFKTQVHLNLTTPDYRETVGQLPDSSGINYFTIKQVNYAANLTISQPLPTDGHIFIQSGIDHNQDFRNKKNDFKLSTRIGFEQPIEAFFTYNKILNNLKNAELQYELQNRRLTRTKLDLNYETSQAFYSYFSAIETEKIRKQTLDQQTESNTLAQNKYKAGVIAEVEALQMEVDLAEAHNNYDLARQMVESTGNNLKQLLAIPLQDAITLETDLSFKIIDVNLSKALEYGLKNRLEIREREIAWEQAQIEIDRTRLGGQITGKISAFYDLTGLSQQDDTNPLGDILDASYKEFKNSPRNKGVAFSISIPIWDWGVNDARVDVALARLRQADLQKEEAMIDVEKDIRNTVNNLKSSLKRLQLLEKNIAVAERSFMISKNRYSNGEINSQSLALDRNRLTQAHQSRLTALINYKLLLEDITRKTFYDFVNQKNLM